MKVRRKGVEEEKEEDMERTQRAREGQSNGGSHQERGEANRPWESTEGRAFSLFLGLRVRVGRERPG